MTHQNLMNNYFNPNPIYNEKDFRPRFGMRHHVVERLLHDVQHVNPDFQYKLDRAAHPGFSPHQKVTIALRMLAYASLADAINDIYGMFESTSLDNLVGLCDTVVQLYKEEYLRGFSGMKGLLDCMHCQWKNCPTGW
ncbi:uncharacterized protein LOC125472117 [Pyrus x bretschneideri]|uniref:uncharacterized protein LOC125472117 n=1 Tax=Pyrus x bretschneideri TaxID=225117 RepID=UPI00202F9A08|nr:uncharacterized protein LOC125472117 [Pyrus x bretschneideri]